MQCICWRGYLFHGQAVGVFYNCLFHSHSHVVWLASEWLRLLWFVFIQHSSFFELSHTFINKSIMLSLHISLNCWWIFIGVVSRKWRNLIITCCSLNVNIIFSTTAAQRCHERVGQCCHLASLNLKNSCVFSDISHVSTCFHSQYKKMETLG